MRYLGSKRRVGKHILEIIRPQLKGRHYVEPFVGGGNMLEKVPQELPLSRAGYDVNYWAIKALEMIRDRADELPKTNKEFTEEMYNRLRKDPKGWGNDQLAGFACFAYSFGGKFADSWCRGGSRDFVAEQQRSGLRQSKRIQEVSLRVSSYMNIKLEGPSLIYCDPPYASTTGYKGTSRFDHEEFWRWAQDKVSEGHIVYVSEYSAPAWVGEPVWSKDVKTSVAARGSQGVRVEKLFLVP